MVQIILQRESKYTVTALAMKFAVDRAEWCNMENIKIMYDCNYFEPIDTTAEKQFIGEEFW